MRSNPDVIEAYESVGLTPSLRNQYKEPVAQEGVERGAQIITALARIQELTAEENRLRAERDRWQAIQAEIMQLLGTKSPDRIMHDLRNVLNERELFRTLADLDS